MTNIASGTWRSDLSPQITYVFAYEKRRSGADMEYRIQITINAVTGQRYFGYSIYSQIWLDGLLKDTHTIKGNSPSQWTSAITYTTGWFKLENKMSGSTALKIRLYSNSDNGRDETFPVYTLPVDVYVTTVTIPDGTIGSAVTITLDRINTTFNHTLLYNCGDQSGTIATNVQANTYSWTIPLTVANAIPNNDTGVITVTCQTFNGTQLIGSSSASFNAAIPSSMVPTILQPVIIDPSGCYERYGAYVQNQSFLAVGVLGTGSYSSKIAKSEFTIGGKTYTSIEGEDILITMPHDDPIKSSGTVSYTLKVTDSRGRTASYTGTLTVLPYNYPNITSFRAYRATANGTESDTGTYLGAKINYSISSLNNQNTKEVYVQYKGWNDISWSNAIPINAYSYNGTVVSTTPILNADNIYFVRLYVKDNYKTIYVSSAEIPSTANVYDVYKTGRGIAFGHAATHNGFEVASDWPVNIMNWSMPAQFTAPTVYSSRCTVQGGYARLGAKVEVAIVLTMSTNVNANTQINLLRNMPAPLWLTALSVCRADYAGGRYEPLNCFLNTNGYLYIENGSEAINSGDKIAITGYYWID